MDRTPDVPGPLDLLIINAATLSEDLCGLTDTAIGVRAGRIEAVGPQSSGRDALSVIDANGGVVVPGFVSAHTHVAQGFGKGIFDGLHLTEWLVTLRRSYADLTDEQVYMASLLACLESVRSGVTFVNDMITAGNRHDIVVQAIADAGIRAHVGPAALDRREGKSPAPHLATAQVLEELRTFHERWDGAGNGRIRASITPVGLPACSEDLMRGAAELAADLAAPLHTHCSEEQEATAEAFRRFGCSEVRALAEFGALGDRTTLAHCVWLSDGDIELIAEAGALVAHCPATNMKITDGIAPVERMRSAGVRLGLGTDGAASSGSYDILQEARLAALLAKVSTMDAGALANEAVWSMLVGSASHFGLTPPALSGRLVPGAPADLVVLGYPSLHLIDERRFLSNLVHSATAGDVRHVVIGGDPVLLDGQFTHHDEADLIDRARRAMATLAPLRTGRPR